MLNTLKALILDSQEAVLSTGISRQVGIEPVPGKATICIGVRRSGKSTYMAQVMQKLVEKGVSREDMVWINFFDDRLHGLQQSGLGLIVDAYYSLYPEKKGVKKIYFFFDEIQMFHGWEPFVERLQRTENCEIYITGSSAKLLSKEIATQMRGRALSWEMFPFSFREFLAYKQVDAAGVLTSSKKFIVQKYFDQYWESGGFPEVAGLDAAMRVRVHQEYFQSILFRDLIERHNITHPNALVDLAHKLLDTTGSLYSINSLTGYLQSLGHKAPKDAVSAYIEWLEDAYFLFTVSIYDASLSRRKANPKKVYCIDHAFVRSISPQILLNSGHLLENVVFMALRRQFSMIYYYKTKNGRETDFLVQKDDRSKVLYQVCETLAGEQTRKRELAALVESALELGLDGGTIVTRQEEEVVQVGDKTIKIVPIWKFLLDSL